ncbi:predicted protein [Naegleria gruberi]|uniref:Predicted protein n=1 Tax=Naegleria gruberi TaxID=5762 RepID=D2VFZ2_NAEGR|nr:uncharacterized protein NAEGRDRAFT_49221 [Naegleria gruberi]EFC44272.1 predicted protein [Naegleria gruberi]|eukprot:XP_002677016.1 predicted protein [Naegleria gruberi strain NEG-M]
MWLHVNSQIPIKFKADKFVDNIKAQAFTFKSKAEFFYFNGATINKYSNGQLNVVAGQTGQPPQNYFPSSSYEQANAAYLPSVKEMVYHGDTIHFTDEKYNLVRSLYLNSNRIVITAGKAATTSDPNLGEGGFATDVYINTPSGLIIDPTGTYLYVAQSFDYVIRRVTIHTTISTIAGVIPRTDNFIGTDGPPRSIPLYYPTGIAMDEEGNIFISDTRNNLIRKVDMKNNILSTPVGVQYRRPFPDLDPCSDCFTGDKGSAKLARIHNPSQICASQGSIIFNDSLNKRIRKVTNGIIDTIYTYENEAYLKCYLGVIYVSNKNSVINVLSPYCDDNYIINGASCQPCPQGQTNNKYFTECVNVGPTPQKSYIMNSNTNGNQNNSSPMSTTTLIIIISSILAIVGCVALLIGIVVLAVLIKRKRSNTKYSNLKNEELKDRLSQLPFEPQPTGN